MKKLVEESKVLEIIEDNRDRIIGMADAIEAELKAVPNAVPDNDSIPRDAISFAYDALMSQILNLEDEIQRQPPEVQGILRSLCDKARDAKKKLEEWDPSLVSIGK